MDTIKPPGGDPIEVAVTVAKTAAAPAQATSNVAAQLAAVPPQFVSPKVRISSEGFSVQFRDTTTGEVKSEAFKGSAVSQYQSASQLGGGGGEQTSGDSSGGATSDGGSQAAPATGGAPAPSSSSGGTRDTSSSSGGQVSAPTSVKA